MHRSASNDAPSCRPNSVEHAQCSPYNARARIEDETRGEHVQGSKARHRQQGVKSPGANIARPPVYRITLVQLAVLVPSCMFATVFDPVFAWSAAAGGMIAVLPQAWFAARAFRQRGARAARDIARDSYIGEVGKFLLSATGFAVVFATVRPIDGLAVFVGFLAMLAIQIFGSWRLLRQPPAK